MYPYLTDIGFEGQIAAKALGYFGLISTASMIVFAPLGDRISKRALLTIFLAIHTVILFWLINIGSEAALWLLVLSYGIWLGAAWPLTLSILSDTFGSRNVSSILGACTLAFGIAGLSAPWLAGLIFDLYRSYVPVFYLTIFLSLLGAVFAFFVRRTKGMM